jgi:Uma2 family endonuclease
MEQPAKKYYTPEEYLALEEKAEYKSEYYKGEIFAMAGGTINHNQITGNLYTELSQSLNDKDCRVFISDMRLWVDEKDLFTYPDIMVICDKPEFLENRNDTVENPLIIIEVLSESTKNYDRGEKFMFYRALPTLREYILVDQYKVHIEQFYIGSEGKWVLTEYNNADDILKLVNLDIQIPLVDIYRRVEFEAS